jgi:hypothetical protein
MTKHSWHEDYTKNWDNPTHEMDRDDGVLQEWHAPKVSGVVWLQLTEVQVTDAVLLDTGSAPATRLQTWLPVVLGGAAFLVYCFGLWWFSK